MRSSLLPFGSFFMLVLLLASRSLGFLDEWWGVCADLHAVSTYHLRRPLTHKRASHHLARRPLVSGMVQSLFLGVLDRDSQGVKV